MPNLFYKAASKVLEEYYEDIKYSNNIKAIYKTQERLAAVYTELNQFEKALKYEAASKKLKDSIETDQKLKSLSFYQTQFETERKEKELQAAEASLAML